MTCQNSGAEMVKLNFMWKTDGVIIERIGTYGPDSGVGTIFEQGGSIILTPSIQLSNTICL